MFLQLPADCCDEHSSCFFVCALRKPSHQRTRSTERTLCKGRPTSKPLARGVTTSTTRVPALLDCRHGGL